jgi:bacterioferritin-associated ferredoxin
LTIILIQIYDYGTMYVCVCHAITDRQIREVVDHGACSLTDVQASLPVAGCCGRCAPTAEQVVEEHLRALAQKSAA